MPGIFISYRREDSGGHALALHDRLTSHFPQSQIFWDFDTIEPGADFAERISQAVGSCDLLIAIIGDQWLKVTDSKGRRRLENPRDFVRLEVAAALDRDVPVIPVLVKGASLPDQKSLPRSLTKLVKYQAIELREASWQFDVGRLVDVLEDVLRPPAKLAPSKQTAPSTPVSIPSVPNEASKMENKTHRTFNAPGLNLDALVKAIYDWFIYEKFEVQVLGMTDGVIIQARQPQAWRLALGLSSALSVQLHQAGDQLIVEIGGAKWADKVAAGAVGVALGIGAITPIYGAWVQNKLPERVMDFIQNFLSPGGASIPGYGGYRPQQPGQTSYVPQPPVQSPYVQQPPQPTYPSQPPATPPVSPLPPQTAMPEPPQPQHNSAEGKPRFCQDCGEKLTEGARFCPGCGIKLA